jgi:hypothetical protein
VDSLRKKKGPLGPELTTAAQPTGQICAECGNEISYMEEAWLLQVVTLQQIGGELQSLHIVDPDDPSGDFLFTPYFFCFSCWESQYDDLKDESADQPPVEDNGSVAECVCCGSSICEGEYCGLVSLGEFQLSRRAPSGMATAHFEMNHAPDVLCMYCLAVLNESYIEMWDDLSQFGECMDCIFTRCWRGAQCLCDCHVPESELTDGTIIGPQPMERR